MVPSITTILQRATDEWATRQEPDAMLAVCGESGLTAWRALCSHPASPYNSSCYQDCMVTPPAIIDPLCRACGSARRLTVKPAPDCRCVPSPAGALQPRGAALRRGRRAVAWASPLLRRWLGWLHARCPGLTGTMWLAAGAAPWMRLSRRSAPGTAPCRHWGAPHARRHASPHTRPGSGSGSVGVRR
jgi:hypothetical protein